MSNWLEIFQYITKLGSVCAWEANENSQINSKEMERRFIQRGHNGKMNKIPSDPVKSIFCPEVKLKF